MLRVDDDFYRIYKKSGYPAPVFTKKLVEQLFGNEEEYRKKNKDEGWIFKI